MNYYKWWATTARPVPGYDFYQIAGPPVNGNKDFSYEIFNENTLDRFKAKAAMEGIPVNIERVENRGIK